MQEMHCCFHFIKTISAEVLFSWFQSLFLVVTFALNSPRYLLISGSKGILLQSIPGQISNKPVVYQEYLNHFIWRWNWRWPHPKQQHNPLCPEKFLFHISSAMLQILLSTSFTTTVRDNSTLLLRKCRALQYTLYTLPVNRNQTGYLG